jgi:hypothetical protein
LNTSNEDLETGCESLDNISSSLKSEIASEIATDNDKDSDEEIKNMLNDNQTHENIKKHEHYHLNKNDSKSDEILINKIKDILADESTNKKDLMRFEKYLEKNRIISTKLDDNITHEISKNINVNHENLSLIEKCKAEKKSFWNMTWCGNNYIVSAFTLGYSHSCQNQINYKQRCMYMFPPRRENSNINIKVELFRYLPVSVYTSNGSGSEIILYSMSRISRKFYSQIDQ